MAAQPAGNRFTSLENETVEVGSCIASTREGFMYKGCHNKWGPVSIGTVTNSPGDVQLVSSPITPPDVPTHLHHKNILQVMGTAVAGSSDIIQNGHANNYTLYEPVNYTSLKNFLTVGEYVQNLSPYVKVQFMYDISLAMSYLSSHISKEEMERSTTVTTALDWNNIFVCESFTLKLVWDCRHVKQLENIVISSPREDETVVKPQRESTSVNWIHQFGITCWNIIHQKKYTGSAQNTSSSTTWPQDFMSICPAVAQLVKDLNIPHSSGSPLTFQTLKDQLENYISKYYTQIQEGKINLLLLSNETRTSYREVVLGLSCGDFQTDSSLEDLSGASGRYTAKAEGRQRGVMDQQSSQPQQGAGINNGPRNLSGTNGENGTPPNGASNISSSIRVEYGNQPAASVCKKGRSTTEILVFGKDANIHIGPSANQVKIQPKSTAKVNPPLQQQQQKTADTPATNPGKKTIKITKSVKKLNVQNMEMLAENMGGDWKRLARKLKFTEGEIDNFDHDNRSQYEKIYQFLREWVGRYDREATLCAVADALIEMNKLDVAVKLNDRS